MERRRGRTGAPRHARPRPPHRAALGAAAVLGTVTAVAGTLVVGLHVFDRGTGASAAALAPARVHVQPSAVARDPAARPLSLAIASIGVRSQLQPLGLTAGGTLRTPTHPAEAGWFSGGPVPGDVGPAVVVGHVDSLDGPAVFSRLSLLHPGDTMDIALSDGRTVRFQVTSVRRYAKDAFPTAEVYGPQPDPQLRLITCGGTFTGDRYLDNVVVFARRSA